MDTHTEKRMDSRARRAAQRAGLVARKSRWRVGTVDNHGEFMLVDPFHNVPVAGARWDMTAADVIEYCSEAAE
jgi:hypothetical protein